MRPEWTFAVVSIALFMVVLDNLVVTTALPRSARTSARRSSRSSGPSTRTRSRSPSCCSPAPRSATASAASGCSSIGLALFTLASTAAAASATTGALIAARAVQGVGAAIVTCRSRSRCSPRPFPADRRGLVLGLWSGISGLGVAIGPLVGGAVVDGISWHWIFWLNVPIGIALVPLAARLLTESHGPASASTSRPGARRPRPARASSTASCAATSSAGRARRSSAR